MSGVVWFPVRLLEGRQTCGHLVTQGHRGFIHVTGITACSNRCRLLKQAQ